MAKLTLTDGTIFEGTTEEIFAITERFNGTKADEPEVEPLKVGDYAKVIVQDTDYNSIHSVGEIVVIKEIDDGPPLPYKAVGLNGKEPRWFAPEHLEKVTDEATAKARKEAVFTQAGRKPNEYRKGDIVRVTKPSTYNDRPVGSVFEVISVDKDGDIYDEGGMVYGLLRGRFEIVAFVESRLDRN